MSYPIGAERISTVLAGAPQYTSTSLSLGQFSRSPVHAIRTVCWQLIIAQTTEPIQRKETVDHHIFNRRATCTCASFRANISRLLFVCGSYRQGGERGAGTTGRGQTGYAVVEAGRGLGTVLSKASHRFRQRQEDLARIPAMPITNSNLMAIMIPIDADHHRSEATLGCNYNRQRIDRESLSSLR
jgi:hypothetical protein